jgi:hypothetical protein
MTFVSRGLKAGLAEICEAAMGHNWTATLSEPSRPGARLIAIVRSHGQQGPPGH